MSVTIQNIFNEISKTYDTANRTLSFGLDVLWRKKALELLRNNDFSSQYGLDICAGTFDMTLAYFALYPNSQLIATDFAQGMLTEGFKKVSHLVTQKKLKLEWADATKLSYKTGEFDTVLCGFGLRNVHPITEALSAVHRVLAKKGRFLVLEFFKPESFSSRLFAKTYSRFIIPCGGWLAGHKRAYDYLNYSIAKFLTVDDFIDLGQVHGFKFIAKKHMTWQICTALVFEKE